MRPLPLLVALLALAVGLLIYFGSGSEQELEGLGGPGSEEEIGPERDTRLADPVGSGGSGAERSAVGGPEASSAGEREPAAEGALGNASNVLTGLVLDLDGEPVAGCAVTFLAEGAGDFARGSATEPSLEERPRSETDRLGRYRFHDLPAGELHALLVHHPEIALARVEGVLVGEHGVFEHPPIVLTPGRRVQGTVRDMYELPIQGARLHLDSRWNPADPQPTVERLSAETNWEGEYRISGVPDGTRFLTVRAEGKATLTRIQSLEFSERTGDLHIVDFVLQDEAPLAGRVVDGEGRPVGGADVIAVDRAAYRDVGHGRATSGPDGAFRITGLAEGSYQLLYRAPGFRPGVRNDVESPQEELELVLDSMVAFRGMVVDAETGAPLRDFDLRLRRPGASGEPSVVLEPIQEVRGAAGGAFALFVRQPRGSFQVEARAEGYAPSYSAPFENPEGGDVEELSIEMTRGGAIVGRLVDDQGEPVSGGRVETRDANWSDDPLTAALGDYFPSDATVRHSRSGRDGRFRLENLRPGSYLLLAQAPRLHRVAVGDLAVDAGGEVDVGELVLTAGGRVHGLLMDAESAPVVGGRVTLQPETFGTSLPIRRARSGADGRWSIENVVPGAYLLVGGPPVAAGMQGYLQMAGEEETVRVTVEAGGELRRDLQFSSWVPPKPPPPEERIPTGTVSGRLLDADGEGVVGQALRLEPADPEVGQARATKTEREGAFTIPRVLPGEYDLLVTGQEATRVRILVEADLWTNQDLQLGED